MADLTPIDIKDDDYYPEVGTDDESSYPLGGLAKHLLLAIGAMLLWCGLTGVGYGLSISALASCWRASKNYLTVEGTVQTSSIDRGTDSDGDTTYAPRIMYAYQVNGKQYTSDRYDLANISHASQGHAKQVADENPMGKKVTVYYDPADPFRAALTLDPPDWAYLLLLLMQPFSIVGLGLVGWCLYLPHFHGRLKRFLADTPGRSWRIPGWGLMCERPDGWTIRTTDNWLASLRRFAAGYILTCFVGAFVVIVFDDIKRLGCSAPEVVGGVIVACLAAGLLAMTFRFLWPYRGSRIEIDLQQQTLSVHSPRRSSATPIPRITKLRLCKVLYPKGVKVNEQRVRCLLLEAVLAERTVPLHAFEWQPISRAWTVSIAIKVQRELAVIMGRRASMRIVAAEQDGHDKTDKATAPGRAVQAIKRLLTEDNYKDLR